MKQSKALTALIGYLGIALFFGVSIAGNYRTKPVINQYTGKQDLVLDGKAIYTDISAVKSLALNSSAPSTYWNLSTFAQKKDTLFWNISSQNFGAAVVSQAGHIGFPITNSMLNRCHECHFYQAGWDTFHGIAVETSDGNRSLLNCNTNQHIRFDSYDGYPQCYDNLITQTTWPASASCEMVSGTVYCTGDNANISVGGGTAYPSTLYDGYISTGRVDAQLGVVGGYGKFDTMSAASYKGVSSGSSFTGIWNDLLTVIRDSVSTATNYVLKLCNYAITKGNDVSLVFNTKSDKGTEYTGAKIRTVFNQHSGSVSGKTVSVMQFFAYSSVKDAATNSQTSLLTLSSTRTATMQGVTNNVGNGGFTTAVNLNTTAAGTVNISSPAVSQYMRDAQTSYTIQNAGSTSNTRNPYLQISNWKNAGNFGFPLFQTTNYQTLSGQDTDAGGFTELGASESLFSLVSFGSSAGVAYPGFQVIAKTGGAWTFGNNTTDVFFNLGYPASSGALRNVLTLKNTGRVGMNTATPRSVFDMASSATGSNRATLGGTSSYVTIDNKLGIRLVGNAMNTNDVIFNFVPSIIGTPATMKTFMTPIEAYAFLVGEQVAILGQEMPHWWAEGTTLGEFHLHWSTGDAAYVKGDKVKWQLDVTCANMPVGTTFTPYKRVHTFYAQYSTSATIAANSAMYTSFGNYTATTCNKIGAQVLGKLTRIAKNAGGTNPAGTNPVFGKQVGLHALQNSIGSNGTGTKSASP